jgi:hypothetical protein
MTERVTMTAELPTPPPEPNGPPVRYVIIQRQTRIPPAPYYDDLATAVAALDQVRRDNPEVASSIVLMAAAVETDTVTPPVRMSDPIGHLDYGESAAPTPEPIEIRVAEVPIDDTPDL